ncbi:MAG: hypothetical protein HY077_05930 [Elusimicrobia bacterium]|nr:hypothetical protein [Elusimicrobiota bacterium]
MSVADRIDDAAAIDRLGLGRRLMRPAVAIGDGVGVGVGRGDGVGVGVGRGDGVGVGVGRGDGVGVGVGRGDGVGVGVGRGDGGGDGLGAGAGRGSGDGRGAARSNSASERTCPAGSVNAGSTSARAATLFWRSAATRATARPFLTLCLRWLIFPGVDATQFYNKAVNECN